VSASPRPKSTPHAEEPPGETLPGPVVREQVEPRWLGVPARFLLLSLDCAAVGAAVGLFVASAWGWGVAALLVAVIAFGALHQAARQKGHLLPEQSVRLAADGRSHAATVAGVWRTRLGTSLANWRTRSRLNDVEVARTPALLELGAAVRSGDRRAANAASSRLDELDAQERSLEDELERHVAEAKDRIRLARLPVQETVMVEPNEPSTPYPPPDEGDPPTPAIVPEPSPPPDEGTPPAPPPDPADD
jgi:hypothetical protein